MDANVNVLPDLSQSNTELLAVIAGLQAKLAKATKPRKATLKVSAKGAVSLYGFGQWPVTLYASQWEKVFTMVEEIKDFIEANQSSLSYKE